MATDGQARTKRKRKYIPGVAAFRFRPDPDWSVRKARSLYNKRTRPVGELDIDQVIYEDCIEGIKRLPDECVDLIIADPPFGINFDGKESIYNRDDAFVISGYEEINDDYARFTDSWISELPRKMKEDASAYVFSGWTNLEYVIAAARKAELEVINHIIWHYQFGVFTMNKYVTSHYHILLLAKHPKKYYFHKVEHYIPDVWTIPRKYQPGKKKNGTVLPLKVVERCIDFSTEPGDLVLDPFMGNGTTAVAAKRNFRHFIGFEINENLRPIIDENLNSVNVGEQYTPYKSRLPSTDTLKKKYPKAYKYLKEQGEIVHDTKRRSRPHSKSTV